MNNIEQLAVQRFEENLEFFTKVSKDIHSTLLEYQSNTNPTMELMYDEKEQYFYISKDSKRITNSPTNEIKFNKSAFMEQTYDYNDLYESSFRSNTFDELLNIRDDYYEFDNTKPHKLIISGIQNIPDVITYIEYDSIKDILIYEDNFEMFYLSLYAIDWYRIGLKKNIFFAVKKESTHNTIVTFFDTNKHLLFSTYILWADFDYSIKVKKDIYPSYTQDYGFVFSHRLGILRNNIQNLNAHIPYISKTDQINTTIPVLLLSSGPSLDIELDWIKDNQSKFLVACAGSSLKKLIKNDIKVDIVFSLDSKKRIAKQFQDISSEVLEKTLLIASEQSNPNILNLFKNTQITNLSDALTVNHFALKCLIEFGFKLLFTIGNDACYLDSDEEYSADVVKPDNENKKKPTIQIASNRGKIVYTNDMFLQYIVNYSKIFSSYSDITIYNLSSGAYIEGFTPLESSNINDDILGVIDEVEKENILNILDDSKYINHYIPNSENALVGIRQVLKKFKKFKKKDIKNIKSSLEYQKLKYDFYADILTTLTAEDFKGILTNFYKETEFVVFINKEKYPMQKYHKLWLDTLEEVLLEYQSSINMMSKIHVKDTFIDKYISIINSNKFHCNCFAKLPDKFELDNKQLDVIYVFKRAYQGYNDIDSTCRNFYIAHILNRLDKTILEYLSSFDDIDDLIIRIHNLYKILTSSGVDFDQDSYQVLIDFFAQIFDLELFLTLSLAHRSKLLEAYYALYMYKRNTKFKDNLGVLNDIFKASLELDIDTASLINMYDQITFIYWGTMQEQSHLKICNDNIIKPFGFYLENHFRKNNTPKRDKMSNHKKKRVCFLLSKIIKSGGYAVGKVEYSLFEALSKYPSDEYEFYIYEYWGYEQDYINELVKFGIKVKLFSQINDLSDKLYGMKNAFEEDEIDVVISDMPWGIPTYLFESRVAPKQMYWSHGWSEYDINGIDKRISHYPQNCVDAIYEVFAVITAENFLIGTSEEKSLGQSEKNRLLKQFSDDTIILGTIGRLIKIDNDEYIETIALIMKQNTNTIYLACGDGEQNNIKAKLRKYDIDEKRFIFTGHINPHVYGWIIDVFLDTFPASQGTSKKEYMAKACGATLWHEKYNSVNMEIFLKKIKNKKYLPLAKDEKEYIKKANLFIRNKKAKKEVSVFWKSLITYKVDKVAFYGVL